MRHAVLMTVRIGFLLSTLAFGRFAYSSEPAPIVRARALIASHNEHGAAELLEDALPSATKADRHSYQILLREIYTSLSRQSRDRGRDREAILYEENLNILDREIGEVTAPTSSSHPPKPSRTTTLGAALPAALDSPGVSSLPKQETPRLEAPNSSATAFPDTKAVNSNDSATLPTPRRLPEPKPLPPVSKLPAERMIGSADMGVSGSRPSPDAPSDNQAASGLDTPRRPESRTSENPKLPIADRAFRERRYEEAGRAYAQLAELKELPADRKEAWAYCRWTEVVRRINAKPRSAKEWDAIEVEIRSIRELNPNNWYGEYLLSRVAEARKTKRSLFPSRSRNQEKLVVRGSQPEEIDVNLPTRERAEPRSNQIQQTPQLDVDDRRSGSNLKPRQNESTEAQLDNWPADVEGDSTGQRADDVPRSRRSSENKWQIRETPNFRVFHDNPELAERAAQIAESTRSAQAQRWGSPATSRVWTPKCDLYLYPDSKVFAKMTGQPEESPGFTMMGANAGKIISRRVNLRADHPQLLPAILPHEVTHVVLADLFPNKPVPRWADEGMAVLSEPPAELDARAAELDAPLQNNRLFSIADLVTLDYPESKDWPTYYAQSISVTRFLVGMGQPEDFVRLLQAAQRTDLETALRNIYQISDLADLQDRWLVYAREQAAKSDVARGDVTESPAEAVETR